MLLHISTDRIIFINGGERIILPYGELEKNLPEFLYEHLPAKAGIDQGSRITVVNGPGSFTNLRIATLALNTYNMLNNFCLDFVSVGKIDWYNKLYNDKMIKGRNDGTVKRYCVMYIGQKKNFWVADLERFAQGLGTREKGLGNTDGIIKLHVDDLKEYVEKLGDDWFVDEMVAEGKEMMDSVFGEGGYYIYSFTENDKMTEGQNDVVKLLEPNYMIEANIES